MGPVRVLRYTLFLGLVLLIVAGPAMAQARAATSGDVTTPSHTGSDNVIRFWYALPDRCTSRFADMLNIFEKAHPQLHVEARSFPSQEALHAALLSGAESPHLALIDSTWQDELIRMGRLQPAEDLMNKVGVMVRI